MGTRSMEGGNRDDKKNCFEKCGLVKSNDDLMEVGGDDLEFERLVRELSPDMSATEYACFNVDIPTSEPMINEHEVDWKERLQEDCINAITTQSKRGNTGNFRW